MYAYINTMMIATIILVNYHYYYHEYCYDNFWYCFCCHYKKLNTMVTTTLMCFRSCRGDC